MAVNTLHELFVEELKDLYSAENQLVKALPKMAKAAKAKPLKDGFTKHLAETKVHVQRLKDICKSLGVSPNGKTCKAMEGLINEGQEVMNEDMQPEVRDAALIAAAQRVEHYEMAGYGCVRTFAEIMGHKMISKTLQKTLNEEGATDKKLTQAASKLNIEAEAPPKRPAKAKKSSQKSVGARILEAVGIE